MLKSLRGDETVKECVSIPGVLIVQSPDPTGVSGL